MIVDVFAKAENSPHLLGEGSYAFGKNKFPPSSLTEILTEPRWEEIQIAAKSDPD